ncbi:unnamed protein product [Peniophora sp. CBMAI 1063]|nr:unnamed protein product [Peniophora sp. CBMAI 1063]
MNDAIKAARQYNSRVPLHCLSPEVISGIFIALSYMDTPSLDQPAGWYFRVNGVCSLWRNIAFDDAELWAINAGSFPSDTMTDLMIERARRCHLCFNGHIEDREEGPSYVLTEYQLSLFEKYRDRLRSFVCDDFLVYNDQPLWPKILYRLRSFPKLEMARIWDDSDSDMWPTDELIDAPSLLSLYMKVVLLPFNARSLVSLRVDMGHCDWSSSQNIGEPYESAKDGWKFPTHEFIMFLKCSPRLERLVITDMPLLLSEDLPSVTRLHALLPDLRVLHLGGKSYAMGDLLERLRIPSDTQVFIDTDALDDKLPREYSWADSILVDAVSEWIHSPMYDSLRLGLTPEYDILLQLWSSQSIPSSRPGGLDLPTSLGLSPPSAGAAFTLRVPSVTRDIHELDVECVPVSPPRSRKYDDDYDISEFEAKVTKMFYGRVDRVLRPGFSSLRYIDYTDVPYQEYKETGDSHTVQPMHRIIRAFSAKHVTASWSILRRVAWWGSMLQDYHLTRHVEEVTIVNFPCAGLINSERYDERVNAAAWTDLWLCLYARQVAGWPPVVLRLAESTSDMSNMARSNEPEYDEDSMAGSYEDAVRGVTQKGYEMVAPFVKSFEDLRIHTWS